MPDLTPLVEYGTVGISIALIILIGCLVRWILKLVGNHINHNTEITTKLVEKIDVDIEAQKETRETLLELRDCIKFNNRNHK